MAVAWMKQIDASARKEYARELERLEQHVVRMRKTPDKRFQQTVFGGQVANWFDPEKVLRLALAVLAGLEGCGAKDGATRYVLQDVLVTLLRRNLPFTELHIGLLLQAVVASATLEDRLALLPGVLAAIQRIVGAQALAAEHRRTLQGIVEHLRGADKKQQKAAAKLVELIEGLCADSVVSRLHPDEGWADGLRAWLAALEPPLQENWNALLRDAAAVYPEAPAKQWEVALAETGLDWEKDPDAVVRACQRLQLGRLRAASWKTTMARHVHALGVGQVAKFLERWLHKVPGSKPGMMARQTLNRELLRGLLWLSLDVANPELAQAVGRATRYFQENNNSLGDVGVVVLFQMGNGPAASALAALALSAKANSHRSFVAMALALLAERGVDADALADESLPAFGFTEPGRQLHQFGDVQAELRVGAGRKVELSWSRGDKPLKSIPAAVQRAHADAIAALKATAKGVRETLSGLVARLEASWLSKGKFKLENWRGQLIDHCVGSLIGRKLIWRFDTGAQSCAAICPEGKPLDSRGRSVRLPANASVALWHPLGATVDEVVAWRQRLEADGVTQPFKQAHREVYLLTDAERATGTYSNRFAAHILRQAQFRQLAKLRGWRAALIGHWEGPERGAQRHLPTWGLRAEFWLDGAGNEFETGFKYLSTDQVRFYRGVNGGEDEVALDQVPTLVFSEVLRDVDLFIGVASVGNDPDWHDAGPQGRHRAYWQRFAFGELSATAETRRAVLERLLPRLSIAARCTLAARFLVVRGKLHTYKIHLGSSNILMSPNDQYLCIVPGRTNTLGERIFLPFEGDRTLAVILSKAFLLADDATITDPDIVSQLKK